MKSQYYREVDFDTFPRKSTYYQESIRSINNQIAQHNINTRSRTFKSEKRDIKNSVDASRKYKQETESRPYQKCQSKRILASQKQNQMHIDCSKIHLTSCTQCEILRQQKQRCLKLVHMQKEQQLTEQKEKYILMQKKYLLKESQFINLTREYHHLLDMCEQLQKNNDSLSKEVLEAKQEYQNLENEINKIRGEGKQYQDRSSRFEDLLDMFLEQTKLILRWTNVFQKNQDRLPPQIFVIKEDMLFRKLDLETSYREALSFKKELAANIQSEAEDLLNYSQFVEESQQAESQRFMKYLKPQSAIIKSTPPNNCFNSKKDCCLDGYSVNKQNTDYSNRLTINTIIPNASGENKTKQVIENAQDQFFRLLLLQAKTIEASRQSRYDQKFDHYDSQSRPNAEHLSHSII